MLLSGAGVRPPVLTILLPRPLSLESNKLLRTKAPHSLQHHAVTA